MKHYEYQRIGRLAEQLEAARIEPAVIDRIMEGGEDILRKTKAVAKADWFRQAMVKMDELIDLETCKSIREGCACALTGKRVKVSEDIARNNASLEDRIVAANEAHFVFGYSVKQDGDDIVVQFFPDGLEKYRCVCLPQADKPLPISYCYCCGGHVKHHLQKALGHKLDCTTEQTALSSGGKKPCTFRFRILED